MRTVRVLLPVVLISALSVLSLVALAAPAGARPIRHEHFHEMLSMVVDECGLTVREEIEVDGVVIQNSHGRDGLVYSIQIRHGTISFTNLANHKTVTLIFNTVTHDLKVTDNGDGTLTVVQADTGITRLQGLTGKSGLIRTGTLRLEFVFDASGTPTDPSDDVMLVERFVKENTGHKPPALCDTLHQFIG